MMDVDPHFLSGTLPCQDYYLHCGVVGIMEVVIIGLCTNYILSLDARAHLKILHPYLDENDILLNEVFFVSERS